MKTFIYDISNQKRVGVIREGWCMVGTEPCLIPEGYVELQIIERTYPTFNPETQTVERSEYANIVGKEWVIDWTVRNLSAQEIEDRKPKWDYCTPRQFRLALLTKNTDPNYVDGLINTIEDVDERVRAKIEWEYAIDIDKNHPLIQQLAQNLGMSSDELNNFFGYATTL